MIRPTVSTVLGVLTKDRLVELGRRFEVALGTADAKADQIAALERAPQLSFAALLEALGRDELRLACRRHGLRETGRGRAELANRLLEARGDEVRQPFVPAFAGDGDRPYSPQPGDVALVRHRQYLVEEVVASEHAREATLLRLACLDDDDQGEELEVLWELELGARVLPQGAATLGRIDRIDEPSRFGAYLHALRWNTVTATDPRLFQSPFRAGIRIQDYQLIPLRKALELPRANLFIADDVGLGKTIEAGLVLQELRLRQRVDFVLVICPSSICLQWRDEMSKRFGLRFEIYDRDFVARCRRERGFAVNPWTTHTRFIVSHALIRRPEYRDPLLQVLGDRARKSLLVLDEAHVAAPASASRYAIDSRITRTLRDIAPRFENRLFLSATPHNGHSNSFSALLEILDPQRFTRGVPVEDPEELAPVLVRRLKTDLRALGQGDFPHRRVIAVDLEHDGGAWMQRYREHRSEAEPAPGGGSAAPLGGALRDGSGAEPFELLLADELTVYRDRLATATTKKLRKRERLVLASLQKRLLSSVEAFYRTLQVHARGLDRHASRDTIDTIDTDSPQATPLDRDDPQSAAPGDADDAHGLSDDDLDAAEADSIESATAALAARFAAQRAHVERMLQLAAGARGVPDAKTLALLDWIRREQCAGVRPGGADRTELSPAERRWSDRRVIVFTEYGDTKRYLLQVLRAAIRGTDDADERIVQLHGGMADDARDAVQAAFNDPAHPARILVATDAAREGVNLQGTCADLFHFDVPWNPARMEQRNGRIDRALQSQPEVRCHYFRYPQRSEDVVLEKLVEKVEVIRRELGSLGAVVLDRLETALDEGIDASTLDKLAEAERLDDRRETVGRELETSRAALDELRADIDDAARILNTSRAHTGFDADALREVVRAGLALHGFGDLERIDDPAPPPDDPPRYRLPPLSDSWQPTLDLLRPPRARDEPFWEWRRRDPLPVIFEPLARLDATCAQLHLQHPFMQRLLQRFFAQGYAAHDLSRVTVLRNRGDSIVRAIALGRLGLFGPRAARLHDELIAVAAPWLEAGGPSHLQPFAERADRKAVESLWSLLARPPALDDVPAAARRRLLDAAPGDFAKLWPAVRDEADHRAHAAERLLAERGRRESADLRALLERQRRAIRRTLERGQQLVLDLGNAPAAELEQLEQDQRHLERRLAALDREIAEEPRQIEELYRVTLQRLQPVGLVYLWPATRG